jgi:hypothetical protein
VITESYIEYLENQANAHPKIAHRKEIGGRTFDVIEQNDIHTLDITRIEINPSAEFCLIAVLPTISTLETSTTGDEKVLVGGFFVMQKYHQRTATAAKKWYNVVDEPHIIGYQIAEKMVVDSINNHPLFHRNADRFDNLGFRSQFKKFDNWQGYLFTFSFKFFKKTPPCTWLDGGKTAY